jgi:hypothetical protein
LTGLKICETFLITFFLILSKSLANESQENNKKSYLDLKLVPESSVLSSSNTPALKSPLVLKAEVQTGTKSANSDIKINNTMIDAENNKNGISNKCFYGSNHKLSNTLKNVSLQNESFSSIIDDSPISSKRRKMNAPNDSNLEIKKTSTSNKNLSSKKSLTSNINNVNNNYNSKNPRFDQENLENNLKSGSGAISSPAPVSSNNGSVKTWNRNNSNKSLGKG